MNRHLSSLLLTLFLAVPLFLVQMRPLFAQSNFIHEHIRRAFENCFGELRAEREVQACAKIAEGSKPSTASRT